MSKYQIAEVTRKSGEVEYRVQLKDSSGSWPLKFFSKLEEARNWLEKLEGQEVVSTRVVE